jgi:outer membrane protein
MKNFQINRALMAKKKIIITMMLILPMAVSAQKFGHINTQELFSQMPEVAVVKLKMDTIQGQYEAQLASMNEEIQKKMQDYQAQEATMADAVKQIRQQELQEMNQRIQLFYQTAEQDIQKKQQELLTPVHERMAKAIKAVGERENYTYIFDSQAMVHIGNDAIDATPAVKKELGIK